MKLRTIILEDNLVARLTLEQFCSNYPYVNFQGAFDTVKEASKYLQNNQVDLIFLDIELKDGISWKLLNEIDEKIHVIVTSSFDQYEEEAKKYANVKCFLKKPISLESFLKSLKLVDI